jgi:hypothetical protein
MNFVNKMKLTMPSCSWKVVFLYLLPGMTQQGSLHKDSLLGKVHPEPRIRIRMHRPY